eukprot:CAMPEP_0184700338 /NCGR_PEP_ID=MMETSP0313-20130426/12203_1 /TAXON_ID=2792 /ORGANISM="Porphyridium aerugineum, Strain SAG 1380-2" /LENGTH=588 /DNA_ID=CAMNT_0027159951 /DNA_START=196 /DNA_END=1959 /DNA_ORIENTATION=-
MRESDIKERNFLNAAAYGKYEQVVKFIDMGVKLNCRDERNWTALHLAVENSHENIVELLLNKGANINDEYNYRATALHIATKKNSASMVKLLLNKGANVNHENNYGITPLYSATEYGFENIFNILVANGANVNCKNENGLTPLHRAVMSGHENIVELLLNHGARTWEKKNDGKTPLDVARSLKKCNIINILSNILVHELAKIAGNMIVPSLSLLKHWFQPEHVIDVASLLAGHNILLIALRGGLLNKPYSALDDDPNWFKERLYRPIHNKVRSNEEMYLVMKVVNQAESLGIIHRADDIRHCISIDENIDRKLQTIGSVITDIHQRINKIDEGLADIDEYSKSIGLAIKQFHEAYKTKRKLNRMAGLHRLLISAISFLATVDGGSVGMGFKLLLNEVKESSNRMIDEFTEVDLVDFRIAQWIVSENYQKGLPEHVRAVFKNEACQTFGGMPELEDCIYNMMQQYGVTPLRIPSRIITISSPSMQTQSVSEAIHTSNGFESKRKASIPAENQAKKSASSTIPDPNAETAEWIRQYNKCSTIIGESELRLADAATLASELSGKDETICESVLRQTDKSSTGRIARLRFVS